MINDKIVNFMMRAVPEQRRRLVKQAENGFVYFAIFYFTEYFTYPFADFHFQLFEDCERLAKRQISEALWAIFRESAKTTIAKIFVTYLICTEQAHFINWDSYAKENSEAALYDISTWLRSNKKIINDYGKLYKKHKKKLMPSDEEADEDRIHRMSSFITENDIKIEAFSTQESTRGRVFKKFRPDCYVFDDFENSKTIDSYPITKKIKDHIDEAKAGLGPTGILLYLCNFIDEEGSVAYIMASLQTRQDAIIRKIDIMMDDRIMWPKKYVETKAEAAMLNAAITQPEKLVLSIEGKREQLGERVFQREMMQNPAASEDKVFTRSRIDELILKARKPIAEKAGLKLWAEYNPAHRYIIAADTAKGIGRDSNASAIIDLSMIPNVIVGTYKNNRISPDSFAYELKRQGDLFGTCLIAPEINETGWATVTKLKDIYPTDSIYVGSQEEKIAQQLETDFGFHTNGATKPKAVFEFRDAIEDGLLVCYDKDLLEEMKYYGQKDLKAMKLVEGMTRHFDVLMASAIAWYARHKAKRPAQRRKFSQTVHAPQSEYGG